MCGIAGVLAHAALPPTREALVAMAGALHHRGPDEQGVYLDRGHDRGGERTIGLAHARLSIIDLASGQQPMTYGDLVISYNGEVFNYVELRAELVAQGLAFHTHSDTEVVLAAYRAWGERCFERFNGQFAIAIWDRATRTLVVARDRLGVRPLYLCAHAGRVWFASEVKAIFAGDPTIPRALDPGGLAETFTFWTSLAPRTPFAGVEELRPGHYRVYAPEGVREVCYWAPRYDESFQGSIEDATEALRAALERATHLRMVRADVTVGSYLSGGLDSSLVAALAQRAIGGQLRTFSLRFADVEYDETGYQREMVARLGSDHSEIVVSRRDIAAAFPEAILHTERPILRTAPAPLYLLARLVRDRGIKVVLTGEGADEMLAGYDIFREARVRRFWAREPQSQLRPLLLRKLYPYLTRSPARATAMAREFFGRDLDRAHEPDFAHAPRWKSAVALQRLFSAEMRAAVSSSGDPVARFLATIPDELHGWDPLARDQYVEIRTLLSGYLLSSQGDRMAMASSVEGRFPFLDKDVVDLAMSLPADYKLRVLDEKHVLKRAAKDLVPASIIKRPKQPYRAPDALAFIPDASGQPLDWVAEVLSERAVRDAGVFEPRAIAQLWAKCITAGTRPDGVSNADNMALVGVLSTQLLHRDLVAADPQTHVRSITPTITEVA
ncbi:MAG: asparagine synthase (glutamine-hydrolyzing) [Proteobacteria bacterium]|nr:asparagine synthase (glutamine-hydrolyzing) [Pseudomonadota bacterium]